MLGRQRPAATLPRRMIRLLGQNADPISNAHEVGNRLFVDELSPFICVIFGLSGEMAAVLP